MSSGFKAKFVTAGLPNLDVGADVSGNKKLQALVNKIELIPGQKLRLDPAQYDEVACQFEEATKGVFVSRYTGGSACNTAINIERLFGRQVELVLYGVLGKDHASDIIHQDLRSVQFVSALQANIKAPRTKMNYVFRFGLKGRSIVIRNDNLECDAGAIQASHMRDATVIAQGAMPLQMGKAFAKEFVEMGRKVCERFLVTYPTHILSHLEADCFRENYLFPSDGAYTNLDEAMGFYNPETSVKINRSLKNETNSLQFAQECVQEMAIRQNQRRSQGSKCVIHEPFILITDDKYPAYIVLKDKIMSGPEIKLIGEVRDQTGAGDAYASYATIAQMHGADMYTTALMAATLATRKLNHSESYHPYPREDLVENPNLWKRVGHFIP